MKTSSAAASLAWLAAALPAARRFRGALRDPQRAQESSLQRILEAAHGSAFYREHRLDRASSPARFAEIVPARSWEELSPWVDRAARGEHDALTRSPLSRFEPTSGSTSGRKLVPSTALGRFELNEAVCAWVIDTYRRDPLLIGGPSYWSISPSLPAERTPGGLPVGFDDDAGYLGGIHERLVRRALVSVPRGLSGEAFWRATARALLAERDLRLISIWSPSFGLLLIEAIERHWAEILPELPRKRERELSALGPGQPWPALRLLSCWADGPAASGIEPLRARFPRVALQPKGLLATEGIVSLPYAGLHPIAVTSHYLELERDDGSIIPMWSAPIGSEGSVLLTTGHGLWRYRLGDRVRVDALLQQTPSIRFLGRQGAVSDLRGEKLSEPFVTALLARLGARGFVLLAPEEDRYVLYAEHPLDAERLEEGLRENPHYAWCVSLGQLRPAAVVCVGPDAPLRYLHARASAGMRHGDIKPAHLSREGGWGEIFRASARPTAPR